MFDGFTKARIAANGVSINVLHGGSGPPILLLHGYPQTHVMWHKVAPKLARHYTVVAPDLRGYGDSDKPPAAEGDLSVYCKRTTAQDQVAVMEALGFDSFHVVGHDRGARVAQRMALDHPERVRSFTSLDVVPSQAAFDHMDSQLAFAWFHWHLMRQPAPLPETLIGNSAQVYLDFLLERWCATDSAITAEAYANICAASIIPKRSGRPASITGGLSSICGTTKRIGAASSAARCWCSGAATWPSGRAGRRGPAWTCSPSGESVPTMYVAGRSTAATSCPRNGRKRPQLRFWRSSPPCRANLVTRAPCGLPRARDDRAGGSRLLEE